MRRVLSWASSQRHSAPVRSPWRAAATLLAVAGAALAVVVAVDAACPRARVEAGRRFHAARFHGCGQYQTGRGSRPARAGCRVRMPGLGRLARATGEVDFAGDVPAGFTLRVNGRDVAWWLAGSSPARLLFETTADERGELELTFDLPAGARPPALRGVQVLQPAPVRPPARRIVAYALAVALAGAWLAWSTGRRAAAAAGVAGVAMLLAAGLELDRTTTLALLPSWLLGGSFGLACGIVAARWGAGLGLARWVALAALLRLGLVTLAPFPCVDVGFHSGTLSAFLAGERVESRAPNPDTHAGALPAPYPPALYALLAPWAHAGVAPRETLVRVALGLLEGSAPLLVLGLARAGGLSNHAAAAAAATAAVMPEGMLVLGKGVAANALASWMGLAALWAALRRRLALTLLLVALAFLSHLGHTLLLLGLLLAWPAYARARRLIDGPWAVRLGLATAGGLLLSWVAYYREAVDLALAAGRGMHAAGPAFFGLRWVRLGKALQDLLLKFGGLTLVPAFAGLRRPSSRTALDGLLPAWLAVGGGAGLVALLTPVPLRFEYFLVPALALLAGQGFEGWLEDGRARRVHLWLAAVFALQASLGLLMLFDRFFLIGVILESGRWPFPIRL